MTRIILLFPLLFGLASAPAQNIYSALHLNEESDYKTTRPKKIEETNIFYGTSGKTINKNVKIFDQAGMIVSEERFDQDGNSTARLVYVNDTVHRIVLSRTFQRKSASGISNEVAFYNYDSSYHLTGVTDKTLQGTIIGTTKIVKNEKGLPVELITYD